MLLKQGYQFLFEGSLLVVLFLIVNISNNPQFI